MVSKYDEYELESLLYDLKEREFIFVNKYKIWRLLGKGSGAAGTWKALLDEWVALDTTHKRDGLHGFEFGNEYFLSVRGTSNLEQWAGER